jgi:hypothetical protein
MVQPVPRTLHLKFGGGADLSRTHTGDRRAAPAVPTMRLSVQGSSNEADYCLARALVEVRRAEEAAHPAARDAHLRMAMLYRQEAGETLDCMS